MRLTLRSRASTPLEPIVRLAGEDDIIDEVIGFKSYLSTNVDTEMSISCRFSPLPSIMKLEVLDSADFD